MKKATPLLVAVLMILTSCQKSSAPENASEKQSTSSIDDPYFQYTGEQLKAIGFPLGGVATGNLILGGRGNIQHMEVFNLPDKSLVNTYMIFALWAKEEGQEPVAKLLERQIFPPYVGYKGVTGYPLSGIARFEEVVFTGRYPFAELEFIDKTMPCQVSLEAWNPFIPLNPDESGIPAAVFNWKIKNPGNKEIDVSIALASENPIRVKVDGDVNKEGQKNEAFSENGLTGVRMYYDGPVDDSADVGNMVVAVPLDSACVQESWYQGWGADYREVFWNDFAQDGCLKEYTDKEVKESNLHSIQSKMQITASTTWVTFKLKPGEEKIIPFYISWYFPTRMKLLLGDDPETDRNMKNYYANQFTDAQDVAEKLHTDIDELYKRTKVFQEALFTSTYPNYVIDALSSQMSSLKTNLVVRIEDGQFYGFEGLRDHSGCCAGTCTHVWNYEQTLAYLFPSLERSMRANTYNQDTWDNGYQVFRTSIPAGIRRWHFYPCVDGQLGGVVRTYREWKLSGDTDWLRAIWPKVKASLEFAWKGVGEVPATDEWMREHVPQPWDANKDGIIEGIQHNTYDIEFYGPNPLAQSIYVAALKAGAKMAAAMGDTEAATEYIALYERASKNTDEKLWGTDYYVQRIEIPEGYELPPYHVPPQASSVSCKGKTACCQRRPPGPDAQERDGKIVPKYQAGIGCLSDQLLGQFQAFCAGMGYIFSEDKVNQALESVYKYNYIEDFSDFSQILRTYTLNDEAGLVLCSWPHGHRPELPFYFSGEVWTGIEYQVAASLIYSGQVDKGLQVVKSVRERHRGWNRDPWDELECGHHYARAMSNWGVMLALSGYQYDGTTHYMGFAPKINQEKFKTFWSSGTAWGTFELNADKATLTVLYGQQSLKSFGIGIEQGYTQANGESLIEKDGYQVLTFENMKTIEEGGVLELSFN